MKELFYNVYTWIFKKKNNKKTPKKTLETQAMSYQHKPNRNRPDELALLENTVVTELLQKAWEAGEEVMHSTQWCLSFQQCVKAILVCCGSSHVSMLQTFSQVKLPVGAVGFVLG